MSKILVLLTIPYFLSAADDSIGDGETWESFGKHSEEVFEEKISNEVEIQDIVDTSTPYAYAPFGKPDPFIPPKLDTRSTNIFVPVVSVLQKYSFYELKVVGIWQLADKTRKALVRTPKNEGIIVKTNDPIGNKGGSIALIRSNFIKIREFSVAPDGSKQFEEHDLWLGEPPQKQETIVIQSEEYKKPMNHQLKNDTTETSSTSSEQTSVISKKSTDQVDPSHIPGKIDQTKLDPSIEQQIKKPLSALDLEEMKDSVSKTLKDKQ